MNQSTNRFFRSTMTATMFSSNSVEYIDSNINILTIGNLHELNSHSSRTAQRQFSTTAAPKAQSKKTNKKNFKVHTKPKSRVPSSGFIGSTNLSLLIPIFESRLLTLKAKGFDFAAALAKTKQVHDDLILNHGVVDGTKKWKAVTLYSSSLLEGRKPENPGWVSTGKRDKWPNRFGHLRPVAHFVMDNIHKQSKEHEVAEALRFLATLFKLNRVCEGNSILDLIGIKSKFKLHPDLVARFEQFARNKLLEIREGVTPSDLKVNLFLGPSNGPNRLPKLKSAPAESKAILEDKILSSALKKFCYLTSNQEFFRFIEQCSRKFEGDTSKTVLRRLTSVSDKGNKSRVIAICDFWTQSALASLERKIIEVTYQLYSYNCSYFSHNQGWFEIMNQTLETKEQLVSLDATNWTDHLPSGLQQIVVKALFGQDLATSWSDLAVKCPWFVSGCPRPFYFGKGQGMGTKGSFAIAQLTDLMFVEFSLNELYPHVESPFFQKVGDDLVVFDPERKLRSRYESIGVEINLTKSKFSTNKGSFYEFVSRNGWNNLDYSIISPSLLSRYTRNDQYLLTFYHHMLERSNGDIHIDDIIAYKELVMASRKNFCLETYRSQSRQLLRIVAIISAVDGHQVIDDPTSLWDDVSIERKMLFMENLVLVTLGELYRMVVTQSSDRDSLIAREKAKILLSNFSFHSDPTDIWHFSTHRDLSIQEVVMLQESKTLVHQSQSNYEAGLNYTAPTIEVFTEDSTNTIGIGPEFLKLILKFQDQTGAVKVGYKTTHRLAYSDKANTKSCIYLHRLLNNILKLEQPALDLETGQYVVPLRKGVTYETMDVGLLQQLASLFSLDQYLQQIRNYSLPEGFAFIPVPEQSSLKTDCSEE